MEYKEIKEMMELFAKAPLKKLHLEKEGFSFKLEKESPEVSPAPRASVQTVVVEPEHVDTPETQEDESQFNIVTSPIVGTFYAAPNPQADPFISLGQTVSTGQTLCIVEAMKLMNEIQSDYSGEVVKCYVENGQPVEYGQKLFAIRK